MGRRRLGEAEKEERRQARLKAKLDIENSSGSSAGSGSASDTSLLDGSASADEQKNKEKEQEVSSKSRMVEIKRTSQGSKVKLDPEKFNKAGPSFLKMMVQAGDNLLFVLFRKGIWRLRLDKLNDEEAKAYWEMIWPGVEAFLPDWIIKNPILIIVLVIGLIFAGKLRIEKIKPDEQVVAPKTEVRPDPVSERVPGWRSNIGG